MSGIGELSLRQKAAILARSLARDGYDDHHLGHISVRQPDHTLLVNRWGPSWAELRACDFVALGPDGEILDGSGARVGDGSWIVSPAVELHVSLHRIRPDIGVGLHHHPRWATVWSGSGRIPPAYDQQSCLLREDAIVFFKEYLGPVQDPELARRNVEGVADADVAFLANHGVLVLAPTVELAHHRAITIEHRSRMAWRVECLGGGFPVPVDAAAAIGGPVDASGGVPGLFEFMARQVIRDDAAVLDEVGQGD